MEQGSRLPPVSSSAVMSKFPHFPNTSPPSRPIPLPMVTMLTGWEYRRESRDLEAQGPPTADELRDLGKKGWELVAMLPSEGTLYLYFKRPD
jgi:hypothetical protein